MSGAAGCTAVPGARLILWLEVCGQYKTNSSMPISRKRPTMSWKYSTDCQGVSGGKQTRECRMEAGSRSAATYRSSKRWLRSAVTA